MCNVHNHEVPSRVVQSIATRVLRESAQATPPIWICGGDWNFSPDGGGALTSQDVEAHRSRGPALSGARRRVGVRCGGCLSYNSCLDWIASSLPVPLMSMCDVRAEIPPVPTAIVECRQALSDHVPARTMFRRRPPRGPQSRPVPQWLTAHPLYAKFARERIAKIPISALPPMEALRSTKQALQAAGRAIRSACVHRRPTTAAARAQLAVSASRALVAGVCRVRRGAARRSGGASLAAPDVVASGRDRGAGRSSCGRGRGGCSEEGGAVPPGR